jgi:hypothetical protein
MELNNVERKEYFQLFSEIQEFRKKDKGLRNTF